MTKWSIEFFIVQSVSLVYICYNLVIIVSSSSAEFASSLDLFLNISSHTIHCLFTRSIFEIWILFHLFIQILIKNSLLLFTSFFISFIKGILCKNIPSKFLFFLDFRFLNSNSSHVQFIWTYSFSFQLLLLIFLSLIPFFFSQHFMIISIILLYLL